ncbi:MAG: DUF6798 domain-containing protein [Anaerolineaceae bacterium]|jgi:hypothetical protein
MDLSPSSKHRLPQVYLVLFCVIVGLISSLWGYQYFGKNSPNYLPQILRVLNPGYLSNDFYLNSMSSLSSPRVYFNGLVAWLSALMGLTRVFLGLTVLCNILITLEIALLARDLFDGSDVTALVSALAVMSAKTFLLGNFISFFLSPLDADLLILPLVLAGIWAALRQRPLLVGLSAGLATLFHPLVGPEVGAILLGTLAVEQIAHYFRPHSFPRHCNLLALLGGGAILAAFSALVLPPIMGVPHIPTAQFVQIYAYFRDPHHLVPSTWPIHDYIEAAVYLLSVGMIWRLSYSLSARLRETTPTLLILCAILLALCLGGYVFVELIPTRLFATAQTFRLLLIFKFIGLSLTGGWIGFKIEKLFHTALPEEQSSPHSGLVIITLLSSLLSPWNLLWVSGVNFIQDRTKAAWLRSAPASLLVLASSLTIAMIYHPETHVYFLVPFYAIMVLALFNLRPRWLGAALISFLALALLAPSLWPGLFPKAPNASIMPKPATSLNDLTGEVADLGSFAKNHTPAGAIFLVDPAMGLFRLTAQRALVVDFKDHPFTDEGMVEWQQRLFDCYGIPKSIGFDAMSEMSRLYEKITDDKLKALQIKYGASYAVLRHATKTQFPVLYHTKDYKIVQIK